MIFIEELEKKRENKEANRKKQLRGLL